MPTKHANVAGLLLACLVGGLCFPVRPVCAKAPINRFQDASFELGMRGAWKLDSDGKTVAAFTVDELDAAQGQRSATVTINAVAGWGTQFGQRVEAGAKGKTYTFAAFVKPIRADVTVRLEIERSAKPWDRAVRSDEITVPAGQWKELHVTFQVAKDFPEGWFAYVSCRQAHRQYRVDLFRLYEGPYQSYRPPDTETAPRVFDTGRPSPKPLTPAEMTAQTGWTRFGKKDITRDLAGDAVLMNSAIAVVLRRGASGAELYGRGPAGTTLRAVLTTLVPAARLTSVRIAKVSLGQAVAQATYTAPDSKPVTVSYLLKRGLSIVQTNAVAGAQGLGLAAPCRFAVMPDFFADDIVADARGLPVDQAELPSEHFLMHMVGQDDAIVMAVWDVVTQDVRVCVQGQGERRQIVRSEIPYGKDGRVWVGVLDEPGIWHACDVRGEQAGKIVPLEWRQPFRALWRVDWTRADKLTGSWGMLQQRGDGKFTKYTWLGDSPNPLPADRKRWTTVLGSFPYPCWVDRGGRGYLQPLRKGARFEGPAVIYPINRAGNDTPLKCRTVVDIIRDCLGVGPCEYLLDIENQRSKYKGRATCSTRDTLAKIYGAGRQRSSRREIEQVLVDVMIFIRHIRHRIETYVAFGHELRDYLASQKRAHPELAGPIGELEKLTDAIDEFYARRKETIKTPDEVAKTVEEFRRTLLTYDGPDALARVKKYTHAWVRVGGSQDELVGECRMAVKWVRQRAGLLLATDPRMAQIAREIRVRTHKVLRNPAGHEGARH